MRVMSAVLLGAAVLGGCADTGVGAGAGGVDVRDSAGVRIVVNHVTGEDVPLGVEEVSRIGVVDGDEHYMFSRISAMATDGEGNLYVANDQSGTIRVFGSDGDFVREIGRRGNGPGEFRGFVSLFVVGDTVAVIGSAQSLKAGLFSRHGELQGDWNLVRTNGLLLAPLAFLHSGWIGVVNDQNTWPRHFPPDAEIRLSRDLVTIEPKRDSVGHPFLRLPPMLFHANRKGEVQFDLFRVPPSTGVDASGRIYDVIAGQYRIDVFEPSGRHVLSALRDYEPVPLGDRDVEAVLAVNDAFWDTSSVLLGLDRATRRRLGAESIRERAERMPDFRSPLRRIMVQPTGGFWVERIDHLPAAEFPANVQVEYDFDFATRWDVFGADGIHQFTVDLPPRFVPYIVTDSSATGVIRDELDVEYVVTYRVREGRRER